MEFMKEAPSAPAEVLAQIKEKTDNVYKLREASAQAEKDFKAAKQELLDLMLESGVDKFQGDLATVSTSKKTSVSCPKEADKKVSFFQYITQTYGKDVLHDLLTVNAKTLSAWHNRELEAKAKEGDLDFKVPGLEPYTYDSLGITKRRGKK